jgi:hypothetical protein
MIATISTTLDTDADTAWELVQRTSTFLYVTRGLFRWSNGQLPEKWLTGVKVRSRMFIFHLLPAWMHELQIIAIDDQKRQFQTIEHGGILRAWNHAITVEPENEARCRYTDLVEIKAGLLTPMVWLLAHVFFRYRQMRLRGYVRSRVNANGLETERSLP